MSRKSILIIEDDEASRELLKKLFENDYDILTAEDGKSGISYVATHIQDLAAILMSLVMPAMNGYQVLQILHSKKIVEKIPVILLAAQKNTQIELACYSLGAAAILPKPLVAQTVHLRVTKAIETNQKAEALADTVTTMKAELSYQQRRMNQYYDRLLEAISSLVEFRNLEAAEHVKRIKGFTEIIAKTYMRLFPDRGLTPEKISLIVRASALHDIGKIAISDAILLKPGRLTEDERNVMKSHTTKGCEILNFLKDVQDVEQHNIAYEICRHHHERHDGGGYPDGLKGDEIPLSAQFVSIADVYDALVSERTYKKPYDNDTAFHMIMNGECGAFNPDLLQCLEKARDEIEDFSDSL